jgi:hypothetical protein
MYRIFIIMGGALALAACSSSPDWLNLDALKPAPILDTVRFESEPPGAEAKTSNGQTCRTPCALALPLNSPLTVTFTLNGYLPESQSIEPISTTGSLTQLQPNPVMVELNPAPPGSQKPVKKPAPKKNTSEKPAAKQAAKPAAKPKPAAATLPPPAAMTAAPAQQQAPAPWPATTPPQR